MESPDEKGIMALGSRLMCSAGAFFSFSLSRGWLCVDEGNENVWSYDKVNHPKDETIVFQGEDVYVSVCPGFETTRFSHFEADLHY